MNMLGFISKLQVYGLKKKRKVFKHYAKYVIYVIWLFEAFSTFVLRSAIYRCDIVITEPFQIYRNTVIKKRTSSPWNSDQTMEEFLKTLLTVLQVIISAAFLRLVQMISSSIICSASGYSVSRAFKMIHSDSRSYSSMYNDSLGR